MELNFFFFSEKGLRFIYGKWTEFLKSTDYDSYQEYLKENSHKFRRSERSKSPNESPAHTPRKVLSKLNSLKMSSFRSLSIQDVSIQIHIQMSLKKTKHFAFNFTGFFFSMQFVARRFTGAIRRRSAKM